jgi:hypothetical protein
VDYAESWASKPWRFFEQGNAWVSGWLRSHWDLLQVGIPPTQALSMPTDDVG